MTVSLNTTVAGGSGGDIWTDQTGTALRRPDGSLEELTGLDFRPAAILGDSISARTVSLGNGGVPIVGSESLWNWANWLVGAPFEWESFLAVSGDLTQNIMSRVSAIPSHVNAVFLLTGTNDIFAVSSAATAPTIAAAIATYTDVVTAGLTALKAAGKVVTIATIPPNNAYTAGDSRIQVLDGCNTFINSLPSLGLAYKVMDFFTAGWDSAQPTARVWKTNYSSDGTHPTNIAAFAAAVPFMQSMRGMYVATSGRSRWRDDYYLANAACSTFNVGSGFSTLLGTGGTGTLAQGWRALRQSGANQTFVCSVEDYVASTDYVGPAAVATAGEKAQKMVITDATAEAFSVRMQTYGMTGNSFTKNAGTQFGVVPGERFRLSVEFIVESPTALTSLLAWFEAQYTQGTSPADQAYSASSGAVRTKSGVNSSGGTDYALPSGFRLTMRTHPIRVPENINGTAAVNAWPYIDILFNGAGGATISIARAQVWRSWD